MLFLLVLLGQNWLCVNAAAEGLQKRTEMMERWQQHEVQVEESRWVIPQRWKQPKGEDRTEMKKEAKLLRCTLLVSTEEIHEKRQKENATDIFLGIDHRLRRKCRSSSTKKPRRDVDLQQTQRKSLMKEQAVRIRSTRRVESL